MKTVLILLFTIISFTLKAQKLPLKVTVKTLTTKQLTARMGSVDSLFNMYAQRIKVLEDSLTKITTLIFDSNDFDYRKGVAGKDTIALKRSSVKWQK